MKYFLEFSEKECVKKQILLIDYTRLKFTKKQDFQRVFSILLFSQLYLV